MSSAVTPTELIRALRNDPPLFYEVMVQLEAHRDCVLSPWKEIPLENNRGVIHVRETVTRRVASVFRGKGDSWDWTLTIKDDGKGGTTTRSGEALNTPGESMGWADKWAREEGFVLG